MTPSLPRAYRGCERLQLRHDPTYWWATRRLPRRVRPAVHALYAYVRVADELVDGNGRPAAPAQRRAALDAWQHELEAAVGGAPTREPIVAALADAGARHALPLHELGVYMDSMRLDCGPVRMADHGELDRYMRGSAGAVGLIMAQLLDGPPEDLARMGTAFQLTNFIRDVAEDWTLDRIYLPGLAGADLDARPVDAAVRGRVAAEVDRARELFRSTDGVAAVLHPRLRPGVRVARRIYGAVLDRVERLDFDVLGRRAALTPGDVARAVAGR